MTAQITTIRHTIITALREQLAAACVIVSADQVQDSPNAPVHGASVPQINVYTLGHKGSKHTSSGDIQTRSAVIALDVWMTDSTDTGLATAIDEACDAAVNTAVTSLLDANLIECVEAEDRDLQPVLLAQRRFWVGEVSITVRYTWQATYADGDDLQRADIVERYQGHDQIIQVDNLETE